MNNDFQGASDHYADLLARNREIGVAGETVSYPSRKDITEAREAFVSAYLSTQDEECAE